METVHETFASFAYTGMDSAYFHPSTEGHLNELLIGCQYIYIYMYSIKRKTNKHEIQYRLRMIKSWQNQVYVVRLLLARPPSSGPTSTAAVPRLTQRTRAALFPGFEGDPCDVQGF